MAIDIWCLRAAHFPVVLGATKRTQSVTMLAVCSFLVGARESLDHLNQSHSSAEALASLTFLFGAYS